MNLLYPRATLRLDIATMLAARMRLYQAIVLIFTYIIMFNVVLCLDSSINQSNRSTTAIMPPTVVFSLYMGRVKYLHMPLLFESIRWNPIVTFYIINIVRDPMDSQDLHHLHHRMAVPNVHIIQQTFGQWGQRVKDRLGLDIPWASDWFYKLNDYKPVVAYLYPEYVTSQHKYWGFADMDLIWGNISRFADWFQGQPFVIVGQCTVILAAAFEAKTVMI